MTGCPLKILCRVKNSVQHICFKKEQVKNNFFRVGKAKKSPITKIQKRRLKVMLIIAFTGETQTAKKPQSLRIFKTIGTKSSFLMCLLPFARFCPLSSDCLLPLLFQREAVYLPNLCCTSHLYYLPLAKRRREPPFDPAENLERLVDEAFAEIEDCKCIEVQK